MTGRGVLCVVMLLLVCAAPAHAGRVPGGSFQLVLAGDRAAWSTIEFQRSLSIESAPPDGPISRIWTAPEDLNSTCDQILDLAGSERWVAALYQHPVASNECGPREVLAGPVGGPLRRVEMFVPDDQGCGAWPRAVALEGDRLAVLHGDCRGMQIAIHDLAAGGPPRIVRPPAGQGAGGDRLRMAGGFIGIGQTASLFTRAAVVVLDAATGAEVYRVDVHEVSNADGGDRFRFDIGHDGRVVLTTNQPGGGHGYQLHLATREDPAPRLVPLPLCKPTFGYDGERRLFVCRRDSNDLAVVDLTGREENVIAANTGQGGLDFDGRRLVWTEAESHAGHIRQEAYPYRAPTRPRPAPLGGGPGRRRALSSPLEHAAAAELAAARGRVMAVWVTGRRIMARLMNPAGAPVRPGIEVSGPAVAGSLVVQPTVAAGPARRWLAAWTGTGAVRARLLDRRGRPAGRELSLPGVEGASFDNTPNVIATRHGYLVAWQSERRDGSGGTLVARLDARGRLAGAPRVVRERTAGSRTAGAALVRSASGAVLTWSEDGAIFAQRLDASGAPAGELRRLSAAGAPQADSVVAAHHGRAGRTLVVWRQGDVHFTGDVIGVVLGVDGRPLAAPSAIRGVSPDFRMDVAPAGRGFLLAGVGQGFLGDRDVYAVRTGLDGRARGTRIRVSKMGPDRTVPRPDGRAEDGSLPALAATGERRVLAAWQGNDDGRRKTRIWVRPLRVP